MSLARVHWCVLAAGLLGGCGPAPGIPPVTPEPLQPEGWDDAVRLAEPEDQNPAGNVLEVTLEARPAELELISGTRTSLWTYNGQFPGPLLRAKKGDRLIVHFRNSLPEPTTIHWHGVRVPNRMDGSEMTLGAVAPGETFTWDFLLLDAGTFWYHPHVNSSAQVGNGLYGALVVEDPTEPPLGDEVTLLFADVSLKPDGTLAPGDENGWFGDYFGREGDVTVVNGKVKPTLKGRAGSPQRWRVINASRARYWKFKVPGARVKRIGGDGGLLEHPLDAAEVVLVPGERAELWVEPTTVNAGALPVSWQDTDRFHINMLRSPELFMRFEIVDQPPPSVEADPPPDALRAIDRIDVGAARNRLVAFGEKTGPAGTAVLTINGSTWPDGAAPLAARVGDTEVWEVENTTGVDHPFHLHGFFFQPLDAGGTPWPVLEWKDTVNLAAKSKLRFAVTWDNRPGMWMFHCHILDHLELGMMAMLELSPP